MRYLPPLWATCYSVSSPSLRKIFLSYIKSKYFFSLKPLPNVQLSVFYRCTVALGVSIARGGKRRQEKLHGSLGMQEQSSDFLLLVTTFLPQRDKAPVLTPLLCSARVLPRRVQNRQLVANFGLCVIYYRARCECFLMS